ncbi:MAG TPA: ParM/StbA family protein, partial [Roseiflexaceae bacterium]|nr:ParM/StbA family protein [Roseiflexaceae bacterium]
QTAYRRAELGEPNADVYGVSGLPGSWADDAELGKHLYNRLKDGLPGVFSKILVIAEPEALALSQLLDSDGNETGDPKYRDGRGLVVDLGSHTDDGSIIDKRRKVRGSTRTYQTGMVAALTQIKNLLSAKFDRTFSLHETDLAVREGIVRIGGGRTAPLPNHWDAPINELADQAALNLRADYGNGSDLDFVLLGGGGALQPRKVAAIQRLYPFAQVVDDPQMAIARGYARLARLRVRTLQAQPAAR